MDKCKSCGKELTPKNVYGGMMGFMYRLIYFWKAKNNYKEFSFCQECRDRTGDL